MGAREPPSAIVELELVIVHPKPPHRHQTPPRGRPRRRVPATPPPVPPLVGDHFPRATPPPDLVVGTFPATPRRRHRLESTRHGPPVRTHLAPRRTVSPSPIPTPSRGLRRAGARRRLAAGSLRRGTPGGTPGSLPVGPSGLS